MRIKDMYNEEDALNMTPLIDMVFLLLIFFLVATRFAQEEREVGLQMPQTSAAQALSSPVQQLIINIREDGTPVIASNAYDYEQLRTLLGSHAREHPDREVLIRADERSIHRYFARVAALCREAGINEVKVGYILEEPKAVPVQ